MNEHDDRIRASASRQPEIADNLKRPGLEGDFLNPRRLGLACARRDKQQGNHQQLRQRCDRDPSDVRSGQLSRFNFWSPFNMPNGIKFVCREPLGGVGHLNALLVDDN
jgi:hypothetical protein